ncbi:MAG: sugar transferase [Sulfobacillus benefaciens]|uniref:Sugar transferase n=1 Tax=Sulfobacillus benefaciens TaxID=453960 RepID=A0A2T2X9B6_9FIRM|nr:MAG: sugar transferase [Sulfobacillus benefaciens]
MKPLQLAIKRIVDLILALILALVTLPLFVVIVVAIRSDSEGPALFKQTRIGYLGRPFTMWKFRTMRLGAEREWQPPKPDEFAQYRFQDANDARITKIGLWLRKTSLDELPQLYNVIAGSMSLVGPRPEIPEMVALYTGPMHRRHQMKPGITGLAQISGRGDLTTAESITWDLNYVEHWNCWLDIKILWWTLGAVLHGQGAH